MNTAGAFAMAARAIAYAALGAWVAGELSGWAAEAIATAGGPEALREPLNLAFAAALAVAWWRFAPGARAGLPALGRPLPGLLAGWPVGMAASGLALLALVAAGTATGTSARLVGIEPTASDTRTMTLLIGASFLLVHALAEEVLVRGVAQRTGERVFAPRPGAGPHEGAGIWYGIGCGAIAFAALQALQGYQAVWEVANSLLFGALLGFIARGPGGIFAACSGHAAWTWCDALAFPAVLQTSPPGSALPDTYASPHMAIVLLGMNAVAAIVALRLRTRQAQRQGIRDGQAI